MAAYGSASFFFVFLSMLGYFSFLKITFRQRALEAGWTIFAVVLLFSPALLSVADSWLELAQKTAPLQPMEKKR
jgi:hypothetical protein